MRTNQTPTEKTVHPMRSPARGSQETGRRGLSGRVRGKLLGGVVTALLALLLWPTAAWAIDGNPLPDAVFANLGENRVCLGNALAVTCSNVSGDTNFSCDVALSPSRPCNSSITTLAGLKTAVEGLTTSQTTKDTLNAILDKVQAKLDNGKNQKARNRMVGFQKRVARLSNPDKTGASDLIPRQEADDLVCAGHNVLTGIPVP
ncbi:MAG: hypothetical protein IH977_10625 [Nitrospinae bacterium]|nr:hypothetical protein [Nitrospinota bacterium]